MGVLTGAVLSGKLTGAHFNPAVTVAVLIADKSSKFRSNLLLAVVMIFS
jgi:glycerol uptake facilitator-like aquaporin